MLPELGQIGPITIRTYTVLLDIAVLVGLVMLAWQGHRQDRRPNAWIDAGLAGLVGGILGGRIGHVALHWVYFIERPEEIIQIWRGGLDWHVAFVFGLAFSALAVRLLKIDWLAWLDALVYPLAFGGALTYTGCLMARCAYGREVLTLVDAPPLLIAELPDLYGIILPRYNTQLFGIVLGILLILFAWLLRNLKRPGVRFWLVLVLLSLGSFGISFWRGDSAAMLGRLRIDQVLDLTLAALALILIFTTSRSISPEQSEQPPASSSDEEGGSHAVQTGPRPD